MQLGLTFWTYPNMQSRSSYLLTLKCRIILVRRNRRTLIVEEEYLKGSHLIGNNFKYTKTNSQLLRYQCRIKYGLLPSSQNGRLPPPHPQHVFQVCFKTPCQIHTKHFAFRPDGRSTCSCLHWCRVNNLAVPPLIVTSLINRYV